MRNLIALLALLLIVAGCGKEQQPAATTEVEDVTEEAVAEAPAEEAPAEEEAAEEEAIEVVEESSGAEIEAEPEAIVLARAEPEETAREVRTWKYREGTNYTRMVPTQPTVGSADKIEVAEIFMYSCPHCYTLESYINQWAENKDPNVRFVRIPAIFNPVAQLHAQLYYTEEILAESGKLADQYAFRTMVFEEFHRRGNRLASEAAIQRLFERAGVSKEDFERTWKSFEVNQKMRVAADLARRYNAMTVPMVVVNGKYKTDAGMAGSYPNLIEVIDELTAREGLR